MLEHGGKLFEAAKAKGIPIEQWLDLSTGISPFPYPMGSVPERYWHRLPEQADGLIEAAQNYYGSKHLLPIAGSQAVIQLLPRMFPRSTVALIKPTYKEHPHAWQKHGHNLIETSPDKIWQAADHAEVIVICNPENPRGILFEPDRLMRLHKQLNEKSGLLIVDEAFIDVTPENSIISKSSSAGLLVLRSLGKFFGMGGARVGFISANASLLEKIEEELGPWTISGPSRWGAKQALEDEQFQLNARKKLQATSDRLRDLLKTTGLAPHGSTAFFQWVERGDARAVFDHLLNQAILIRYYHEPSSIRFGLPANQQQFDRLEQALRAMPALV